ncbi:MAG: hypothetical protein AAF622_13090 [Cyanobacteria bacterium P01_C01_bin.147]
MTGIKNLQWWGLALLLATGGVVSPRAWADEFPPCAPPSTNEYLLLVQGDTVEARDRIQNLLPTTTVVSICRYLDDVVVRAGGFTSLENANAWAQYLTEVEDAQAFVARPAAPGEVASNTPIAAEPVEPAPTPAPVEPTPAEPTPSTPTATSPNASAEVAYTPKLLGEGYAVLVNYGNDPAVAKQLEQTLNQPVGLAIYEQRPFLLAIQSADPQAAAQVLQTLSNNRFGAFIVDSSDVVLLSGAVATP